MNILITGSSGQIGTNLALALLARGDYVTGLDIRPNTWTDKFPTVQFDLVEAAHAPDVLISHSALRTSHFDAIVHLAAHAKVHELVVTPHKALQNVNMAFAALELARAKKCPIAFGSSREVYGDIHRHVTDESMADFVVAESPYSASKIAGEAFFYSYARCYRLPTLVFRFSNVYGRYDNDEKRMERVIPLFVRKINEGEPIRVFGRDKMLDFTYIDDCISGIVAGLDRLTQSSPGTAVPGIVNQTVNLAYGQGQTLYDLVSLIEMALGKKANATYEKPLTGEVTRYVADISKARQLLGYTPQTPLPRGIQLYLQWQKENGYLR